MTFHVAIQVSLARGRFDKYLRNFQPRGYFVSSVIIGSPNLGYQLAYRVTVYGNGVHQVLLKNWIGKLNFKVFVPCHVGNFIRSHIQRALIKFW